MSSSFQNLCRFPAAVAVVALLAAPTVWADESSINDVEADYICELAPGGEQIAFKIPSWNQVPRVWLTMDDADIGLDTQVDLFGFLNCPYCFRVEGRYVFSGSGNRYVFTTEPLLPESSVAARLAAADQRPPGSADEDLPPGSGGGDAPPGSGDEDLPPGSGDPPPDEPVDPPSGEEPFDGPELKIRYLEKTMTGERIVFQGEGFCRVFTVPELATADRRKSPKK